MQRNVLIVDDSSTMRASISSCLGGAGYLVTEAVDGRDALEKIGGLERGRQPLLLLVTDINMPVMDGIALIDHVRSGHFRFVPILVLSSETHEVIKRRGRSVPASGWLQKPFDSKQLLKAIQKLVW